MQQFAGFWCLAETLFCASAFACLRCAALQCGMARMPNSPALLVMYASFLIEARKDGQAARTQLQLAQKAAPSLLDNYNIYVAQQLAKQLKRGGWLMRAQGELCGVGLLGNTSLTTLACACLMMDGVPAHPGLFVTANAPASLSGCLQMVTAWT